MSITRDRGPEPTPDEELLQERLAVLRAPGPDDVPLAGLDASDIGQAR